MTDDDRKDPTVKELLAKRAPLEQVVDAVTAAELQRWFGLPSFESLPAEQPAPDDPEMVAVRERRANAIAAVSPALVDAIYARVEPRADLIKFSALLDVKVVEIAMFDHGMVERTALEPREVEISDELRDDLNDCTPQALLRDLHRSEKYFDKQLEVIDYAAEGRVDASRAAAEAMATSWRIAGFEKTAWQEGHPVIVRVRAERKQRWDVLFNTANLPNREADR